ncbi:inositol monophosphatase family protein [Pararhizobium sp. LjRoot238]|uniref:inositol monophosphatase family protein n=1 Tax=Pararhizobium sp. LjRoot238 TaxID=3342293 RepID=UPI003F506668
MTTCRSSRCSSSAPAAPDEATGILFCCVALCLVVGGELELGIVYNPLAAAFLLAKINVRAFLNGRPINVSCENGRDAVLRRLQLSADARRARAPLLSGGCGGALRLLLESAT